MEDKIKYVLNGETKYYTKEELKEYYTKLRKTAGIYHEDSIDEHLKILMRNLKKYNGDPYGRINNPDTRKFYHEIESMGSLYFVR